MNKVILVKKMENELRFINELDNELDARVLVDGFTESVKFNMDFAGTYYLIPVQKIEIKRV